MLKKLEHIIHDKLTAALNPDVLKIENDTKKHQGHEGYKEGYDTHFNVKISSQRFDGLSHLEKHRLVYDVLEDEMKNHIHALSLTILTSTRK